MALYCEYFFRGAITRGSIGSRSIKGGPGARGPKGIKAMDPDTPDNMRTCRGPRPWSGSTPWTDSGGSGFP